MAASEQTGYDSTQEMSSDKTLVSGDGKPVCWIRIWNEHHANAKEEATAYPKLRISLLNIRKVNDQARPRKVRQFTSSLSFRSPKKPSYKARWREARNRKDSVLYMR